MRGPFDRNGPATRREILTTLQHEPGLTKSQLCRALDLSWGTVSHHVRLLERTGALVRRRLFGRDRLFLPDVTGDDMALGQLARHAGVTRLLDLLAQRPGVGIQALALTLDVDRRMVRRHLDLLIENGLVAQTPDYRPRFFVIEQTRVQQILVRARAGGPREAQAASGQVPALASGPGDAA